MIRRGHNDYYCLGCSTTFLFNPLTDEKDPPVKCNCENSHCEHVPGECAGEGKIEFDYVGLVCPACAEDLPKEYLKEIPIGTLLLYGNRFGIVRELRDGNGWLCEGLATSFSNRFFLVHRNMLHSVKFDIPMTNLYDFEVAVGENIYDSFAYAKNCKILETTKNASGRVGDDPLPVYFVKAYDPDADKLVWLTVSRFGDGHLRWHKP